MLHQRSAIRLYDDVILGDEALLYMTYPSTDVLLVEEIKLINFSGLVSAVGGSIGLFTGFSFLGGLFYLKSKFRLKI